MHNFESSLLGWAVLYGVFLVGLFALSYPVIVVGALALVTTIAFGVRVRRRRRDHRARRRCVPVIGVCVEL